MAPDAGNDHAHTQPTTSTATYGTWPSPISAGQVAAAAVKLSRVLVDADDIYWLEGRPAEGGRHVVVRRDAGGRITDVTPPGTNVRTRVHEYGGAAFLVDHGTVYFSEFADGRIYALAAGDQPRPLTPPVEWWFADGCVDRHHDRLIFVREDHTPAGEAVTTLVGVPLDGSTVVEVLVSGHDFYSTPRLSPDGTQLAWIAWNHPQMPWDGTELWLADVEPGGRLANVRQIGGGIDESVFQPGWHSDGHLMFASDRTGWWNLYRWRSDHLAPLHAMDADCGRPQWQFGMSTWASAGDHQLVTSYQERGRWQLARLDLAAGTRHVLAPECEPGDNIAATSTHAVIVAGSTTAHEAIALIDLATGAVERIRSASAVAIDLADVSIPSPIDFATDDGQKAHAFFYAPHNARATGPDGERPPLIVVAHGGPTASTSMRLNLEVQYWTSRGFAVVDVNYRGSSGYGRAYRRLLEGRWGIADVADCVNAARHLAAAGHVDGRRLAIRGRSAGGFVVLAALAFHPEVFAAGASYYGISDLEAMQADTHKFESRYLDTLIGPFPARRDLYHARSPVHAVDRITCPLIVFQGTEDRVVPPNQAEMIADALRARNIPVTLRLLPGEQHGFRRQESIVRCLDDELAFYRSVLA